ncbi:collagen alpha-1(XXI) chain-like [Branchiostoma floridae x Branchiostoma belcheri]
MGGCSTDIVLVLDDSSSITPAVFFSSLSYMVDFTKCGNETGVGVVVFNCIPRTEVSLGLYTMGDEDLKGDIEYIMQQGGLSRPGPAIRYTVGTTNWSAGAHRVMIVLTDGFVEGEPLDDHQAEANAARAAGITLYSVGIGNLVDNGVLEDIAGGSSRVFDDTNPCDLYDKIKEDCD